MLGIPAATKNFTHVSENFVTNEFSTIDRTRLEILVSESFVTAASVLFYKKKLTCCCLHLLIKFSFLLY